MQDIAFISCNQPPNKSTIKIYFFEECYSFLPYQLLSSIKKVVRFDFNFNCGKNTINNLSFYYNFCTKLSFALQKK